MTITSPRLGLALLLIVLAAGGGVTATMARGDDPPSTAAFRTVDGLDQFQLTQGTGSQTSASIVTGGTVTFASVASESHNVDVTVPAQGGVSCQQTVGGTSPSAARFPNVPTSGSWAGVCTFTRAGTYSFQCDQHEGMTGTVVVTDAGSTQPTAPTAPVTATTPVATVPPSVPPAPAVTPAVPVPSPAVAQSPDVVVKALAFRVVLAQHGSRVRGSVSGARSTARVTVALTARRADLGLAGRSAARVGVGSLRAVTTTAGALSFSVRLDAAARAALIGRRRLVVTLQVTAASAAPRAFTIVMRP